MEELLLDLIELIPPDYVTNELDQCGKQRESLLHLITRYPEINYKILFKTGKILNVNVSDNFGRRPLHIACDFGNLNAIQTLVNHGAEIDLKTGLGETPLMHLLSCRWAPNHWETLHLLVEYGADVNSKDQFGHNALHIACCVNNVEAAKFIIFQGYDINAKDQWGRLPIDLLCQEYRKDIVEYMQLVTCR